MRGQVYVCVLTGATMVIAPHPDPRPIGADPDGVRAMPMALVCCYGFSLYPLATWQWRFVSDCIETGVYSENGPMPL